MAEYDYGCEYDDGYDDDDDEDEDDEEGEEDDGSDVLPVYRLPIELKTDPSEDGATEWVGWIGRVPWRVAEDADPVTLVN